MGLGLVGGGVDVVKWLAKQGAKITVTDLKNKEQLAFSLKKLSGLKIKYALGKHHPRDFQSADLIIKNPAVSWNSSYLKIARQKQVPIVTDISLFFRLYPGQIIGVTGTKGKSTTTSLIYQIFKQAGQKVKIAGNIGRSPLKHLSKISGISGGLSSVIILELSSFQLENLKVSPSVAVLTNIFPDHLNRHRNLREYIKAKEIIFKYQQPGDTAILNYDNRITRQLGKKVKANCFYFSKKYFSQERGVFLKNRQIYFRNDEEVKKISSLSKIKISGEHNLENVLAAVTAACVSGIKPKVIQQVLVNFSGLANRLELIRTIQGVKYYNDTAATIPQAVMAAIKTLSEQSNARRDKPLIIICGGTDKNLQFKEMAEQIKKYCRAVILLPGTASQKLKLQIGNSKFKRIGFEADSMKIAVDRAKKLARRGDVVLLSPGCASFGLFKNEFDRGKKFIKAVKTYA